MELEAPDEGTALDGVPRQEQSVRSSSDTAKQSRKLPYPQYGKSETPIRHVELLRPNIWTLPLSRSSHRLTTDSASTRYSRPSRIMLESFKLERVVPAADGRVTHEGSGVNELISILNEPFEIKAILCTFNLNTGRRSIDGKQRAQRDKDILEAIDAIGNCQSLEKLTIVGCLDLEHLVRLCQSVRTSKVGHLQLSLNLPAREVTTICKEALLGPLTGAGGQLPVNTSLTHISLPRVCIGHKVAESVAAMLTSNKTLTHLILAGYVFSEPSDVCRVLQSLTTNEVLETLDLVDCRSHFGWEEEVFAEMLHLTQANLFLKSIELSTAQFGEGQIEAVKAELAANAIKRSGTNVENLKEKALRNPMMPQFSDEIEVAQHILERTPSESLGDGLDNLEENRVMQNTTSIANDCSHFCLRNDVLATSTPAIDSMTLDIHDLVSTLNMPCAFSAIDCNFQLAGSYSAFDRKKRLEAINAIGRCPTFKRFTISGKLDLEQIQQLCKSLQATQVEYLELCISGLPYRGLTSICDTVVVIPSLKHFKFIDNTMKASLGVPLGSMLGKNSTLEHLDLGESMMSHTTIQALLGPLTGAGGQLPVNTSLTHISLPRVCIGHKVAESVAAMLTSNKTLTHLILAGYVLFQPSDACMVLESLSTNEVLETLDLVGCISCFRSDEDVFAEMLHLTQVNLFLKNIELSTAQFGEGHIEAVKAQLAANAIKRSGTNVENLKEKALHNPMMPQFSDEIEVPQHILERTPSDSLGNGLDNLEENRVMQNTTSIANDCSQFCLRNDELATATPAIDSMTLDIHDLVSTLNMPCAFSAIDCNFQLAGSYSAFDRKKRLEAINAIGRCPTFKRFTISGKLDLEQIQQLCKSLQATQVEYLGLCISGLPYRGLTSICETLVVIPSLKHFKFVDKTTKAYVGASFESMLAKNSTLEHLDLGGTSVYPDEIEALLRPLTGAEGQLPVNTSLKQISLPSVSEDKVGHRVAEAVAAMLTSNKTLTHLSLLGYVFSEPSDVCMVLQSLRTNETLQTLDLVDCRSHFGWEEDVFAEMLHLTQANTFLKSIELSIAQFGEGHIEAVKAQLAANAIKRSGTNVENPEETALHNPMMPQCSVEIEVPQEILECRPSGSLEMGLDNLEVSACESKSITRLLDFEIAIKTLTSN
ncbi:unnamed protein product [Sphagnum tenellum]